LSVHKATGGTVSSNSSPRAASASPALKLLFAATPPATTNRRIPRARTVRMALRARSTSTSTAAA
jgi:hypothetical protein